LSEFHQRKSVNAPGVISAVLSTAQLKNLRAKVNELHIDQHLIDYIAHLIQQTRSHQALYLGASPRASLALMTSAKAMAALRGRDFVTPEDIQDVCYPVLRHRLLLAPEKEMEGTGTAAVIKQILEQVEIPR